MAKKRYMINGRLVAHDKLPKSTVQPSSEAKAVEAPPVGNTDSGSEFEKLTVAQLQEKLTELEIEFPKSAKKGDLIDLLEAIVSDENEPEL